MQIDGRTNERRANKPRWFTIAAGRGPTSRSAPFMDSLEPPPGPVDRPATTHRRHGVPQRHRRAPRDQLRRHRHRAVQQAPPPSPSPTSSTTSTPGASAKASSTAPPSPPPPSSSRAAASPTPTAAASRRSPPIAPSSARPAARATSPRPSPWPAPATSTPPPTSSSSTTSTTSASLDPTSPTTGYTVFGKIIQGWSVVQTIEALSSIDLTNSPAFAGPDSSAFNEVPVTSDFDPNVGVRQSTLVNLIAAEVIKPASVAGFFAQQVVYPEGFRSGTSIETLTIVNPNSVSGSYQIIARYETGQPRHRHRQRHPQRQHQPLHHPL